MSSILLPEAYNRVSSVYKSSGDPGWGLLMEPLVTNRSSVAPADRKRRR